MTARQPEKPGRLFAGAVYVAVFAIAAPLAHLFLGVTIDRAAGNPPGAAPSWLPAAGGILTAAGLLLVISSMVMLHRVGRGLPLSSSPPLLLVTDGPYKVSRHPIYLGAFLAFLGFSLLIGSFWSTVLAAPLLGLFYFTYACKIEEPVLLSRFGDEYRQYRERTALFVGLPSRGDRTMTMDGAGSTTSVKAPRYVEGRLHWYGCDLNEIAGSHDTPTHVGCTEAVKDSLEAFHAPFEAAGVPIEVRYSVKTNPLPALLKRLQIQGAGFEVCSGHELELVNRMGTGGERIVATGLRDGFSFAARAGEIGVEMLTVSTAGQLQKIIRENGELPDRFPLALTICPELLRGRWDLTLNTGARGAAIGFRPGSSELEEAIGAIASHRKLELVGLHMHIGSGILSTAPYRKGLKVLESVIYAAARLGQPVRILDIGGGFGLKSAPVLGAWKIVSSLLRPVGRPTSTAQPDSILAGVAKALAGLLERLRQSGICPEKVIAEPGRIISGPCQLLLLTVVDVVDRGRRSRFLLCDGGSMAISPMLMAEGHKVLSVVEPEGELIHYRILGNLPTSLDRVSASSPLPEMHPGDRIAVLDTGAYFISMNNTFIGPRPPVVWIEKGKAGLTRRRETRAEVFARDIESEYSEGEENSL